MFSRIFNCRFLNRVLIRPKINEKMTVALIILCLYRFNVYLRYLDGFCMVEGSIMDSVRVTKSETT